MELEEEVTEAFRRDVRDRLERNRELNKLAKRRKGEPGYLISNRAELADAVDTDSTQINNIIGPVRPTSKWDPVDRSAFVSLIRNALDLARVTQVTVPTTRVKAIRLLAEMDEASFALFEAALLQRMKRNNKDS